MIDLITFLFDTHEFDWNTMVFTAPIQIGL